MIKQFAIPKSKKRKITEAQRIRNALWLKSVGLDKTNPKKVSASSDTPLSVLPSIPPGRETPNYESLDSGIGNCIKKEDPKYTGNNMIGIGTLHKSNAVPVFSSEEAINISTMRR